MLFIPSSYLDLTYSDNHPYAVDLAHVGQGNWRAFRAIGISLSEVLDIARSWSDFFAGIDRPWLCWHVDDEWSIVQQRLVASVGWTPIVGFDPRVGPPRRTIPQAIIVDFNKNLGLPILYPHFTLEFAFLYCKKIAFWHSDLLIDRKNMEKTSVKFNNMEDGQTFAIRPRREWKQLLSTKNKRYWELVGCTTKLASKDQFENGCGWWMDFWAHPNQKNGQYVKQNYYWDHGSGIYYWNKIHGGDCEIWNEKIFRDGHFTKIGNKKYKRFRELNSLSDGRRNMASEIKENFSVVEACKKLHLEDYMDDHFR